MDIVARAKAMLLSPKTEWQAVAAEPADVVRLYNGYIIPLALIPPVAALIRWVLFSQGIAVGLVLGGMVLSYLISLVAIYVFAFIASKLAPSFNGRDDLDQALKLVAYAGTARWVGGIFLIIPWIGPLLSFLMSLYGLYLLWLGTMPTLGIPEDRSVIFTIVLVAVAVVVALVIGAILAALFGAALLGAL